jgi:hypothetical protein
MVTEHFPEVNSQFSSHSGLSSKSWSGGKTLKERKINEKVERVRGVKKERGGFLGLKTGLLQKE